MIKLHEAELTSILPFYIKNNVDIQSVSYAFKMAMSRMLKFAQLSSVLGNIDRLPEQVLDLLAIELRSQYYDEGMEIQVKRNIIKNSLAWYAKGGTTSAVAEMVETVFGEGKVTEWYDFDGEPGTFRIDTNTEMSPQIIKQFNEVIHKVKNKKSHLTDVRIDREIEQSFYMSAHSRSVPHIKVRDNGYHVINTAIKRLKD